MAMDSGELAREARVFAEDELLAGHQKSWVNVRTGQSMRLSQTPPRPDHDLFLVLNAEAMGVDLSVVAPDQLGRVLQARSRTADTSSSLTKVAGEAGWVRVHRNTRTREVNVDAMCAGDALVAARIAAVGMRPPRSLSLDLLGGMDGNGTEENLLLGAEEAAAFLQDGMLPDGCGGTRSVQGGGELQAAVSMNSR